MSPTIRGRSPAGDVGVFAGILRAWKDTGPGDIAILRDPSFESALAHIQSPPLPESTELPWQQALLATGIPQKSVSEDFLARFTDFYLAERTWLGRGANANEAPSTTEVKQSGGCCG